MKICRFVFPFAMLLNAGCLMMDQTLTLNADGSGSIDLTYSISEQAVTQTKAMLKLKEQMIAASGTNDVPAEDDDYLCLLTDPEEHAIRERLQKYAKHGLAVDMLKVDTQDARRRVYLKVLFKDIARLAEAEFFPRNCFSLKKNSDGNYVFSRETKTKDYKIASISDSESIAFLSPLLAGFDVTLKIKTPGRILQTNGVKKSPDEVEWHFNFDQDPNAVIAAQHYPMEILFDGSGLTLPEIAHLSVQNAGQ